MLCSGCHGQFTFKIGETLVLSNFSPSLLGEPTSEHHKCSGSGLCTAEEGHSPKNEPSRKCKTNCKCVLFIYLFIFYFWRCTWACICAAIDLSNQPLRGVFFVPTPLSMMSSMVQPLSVANRNLLMTILEGNLAFRQRKMELLSVCLLSNHPLGRDVWNGHRYSVLV